MITRPFIKYAGSKWIMSAHYPPPKYDDLNEYFAGSACYATRYYTKRVTLVERDHDIAELWRYLICTPSRDIERLPATLPMGTDIRNVDAPRGAQVLIRQWQRVGMSKCWTVSKWCGANTGFWCAATRDAIARQVDLIRHWRIIEGNCLLLTPRAEATWFLDPPYRSLPLYGSRDLDYAQLARWVLSLRGQVIVCELDGADWLPFHPFREIVTGRRNGRYSREAIYTARQV